MGTLIILMGLLLILLGIVVASMLLFVFNEFVGWAFIIVLAAAAVIFIRWVLKTEITPTIRQFDDLKNGTSDEINR